MSVGTIVTIVLLMSVLVLGIFLVAGIFDSAGGAIELTDQQLRTELENLFTDDDRILAVYPDPNRNKPLKIKRGDEKGDAIGIAIRNMERLGGTKTFSYEIKAIESEPGCPYGNGPELEKLHGDTVESWISLGRTGSDIAVTPGTTSRIKKVNFRIPTDAHLCEVRFRVTVKEGTTIKDSEEFDVWSVP